jgi:hypothetical protein
MITVTVCREISPEADEFMESVNRRANRRRPTNATDVKVRVLDGQAVTTVWDSYIEGNKFDTSAKQAERLVELGIVEIVK